MQRLHTAVHGHDVNADSAAAGEPFDETLMEQVKALALKSSSKKE